MLDHNIYPNIDLNTYEKEAVLKDGTKILFRPMVIEDQEALYEFFKAVSAEEARYLRDDVKSRLLIESWAKNLDYNRTLPILAIKDDIIIADATINRRLSGWKYHIGTVRIFVHEDYRNLGLGKLMIMISSAALEQRVKLRVEDPSTPLITFFYFVLKNRSNWTGKDRIVAVGSIS